MLAQLTFSGTITLSQVFGDIIGILTGSITTPAGLSASFVPGSSTIISSVAPGWSLYDNAAGTLANGVTPAVIRAPWSDDGTKYKNVYINAISATQLCFNGYETWNSATHTGTNPCKTTPTVNSWQIIDLSNTYNGGKLIISASANHYYLQVYTSALARGPYTMLSEYTRDDPWCTVANGYPAWVTSGCYSITNATTYNTGFPRLLNTVTMADTASGGALMNNDVSPHPVGAGATAVQATTSHLCNIQGGGFKSLDNLQGADASKVGVKYLFDLSWRQSNTAVVGGVLLGGNMSAKNGSIYVAPNNLGTDLDELNVGSDSYLLVVPLLGTTSRIALKKA